MSSHLLQRHFAILGLDPHTATLEDVKQRFRQITTTHGLNARERKEIEKAYAGLLAFHWVWMSKKRLPAAPVVRTADKEDEYEEVEEVGGEYTSGVFKPDYAFPERSAAADSGIPDSSGRRPSPDLEQSHSPKFTYSPSPSQSQSFGPRYPLHRKSAVSPLHSPPTSPPPPPVPLKVRSRSVPRIEYKPPSLPKPSARSTSVPKTACHSTRSVRLSTVPATPPPTRTGTLVDTPSFQPALPSLLSPPSPPPTRLRSMSISRKLLRPITAVPANFPDLPSSPSSPELWDELSSPEPKPESSQPFQGEHTVSHARAKSVAPAPSTSRTEDSKARTKSRNCSVPNIPITFTTTLPCSSAGITSTVVPLPLISPNFVPVPPSPPPKHTGYQRLRAQSSPTSVTFPNSPPPPASPAAASSHSSQHHTPFPASPPSSKPTSPNRPSYISLHHPSQHGRSQSTPAAPFGAELSDFNNTNDDEPQQRPLHEIKASIYATLQHLQSLANSTAVDTSSPATRTSTDTSAPATTVARSADALANTIRRLRLRMLHGRSKCPSLSLLAYPDTSPNALHRHWLDLESQILRISKRCASLCASHHERRDRGRNGREGSAWELFLGSGLCLGGRLGNTELEDAPQTQAQRKASRSRSRSRSGDDARGQSEGGSGSGIGGEWRNELVGMLNAWERELRMSWKRDE